MACFRLLAVSAALAAAATGSACTCRRANGAAESGSQATRAEAQASGSSGRAARDARAEVLRASAQCGTTSREGDVRWLGSEDAYRAALEPLDRLRLSGDAQPAPEVDFETRGVLLVEMGQRATAGYALDLGSDEVAVRDDGTGVVRVNWSEPPENGVVAQVLTSPCLLVAVPKEGLRTIEVVDQAGRTRGEVEVR